MLGSGGGQLIGVKVNQFFDRPAVKNYLDRRSRHVLRRYGAFVRMTARRSMRKRKGPSLAGQPPHAHPGHGGFSLRDSRRGGIVYGLDSMRASTVVGPLAVAKAKGTTAGETVPEVLEYGGVVRRQKAELAHYPPRPFMRPAHAKALDKQAEWWREADAKY